MPAPIGKKHTIFIGDESLLQWREAAESAGFVTKGGRVNWSAWARTVLDRAAKRHLRKKPRPDSPQAGG